MMVRGGLRFQFTTVEWKTGLDNEPQQRRRCSFSEYRRKKNPEYRTGINYTNTSLLPRFKL